MAHQYGVGVVALAAITAALALNGCDQRNEQSMSTSTSRTASATPDTSTPPTGTDGQKMAAATQKAETAVDDSALTAKVKAAMLGDPGLKSLAIDVTTVNGTVTLSGAVDSTLVREHAKEVASNVSGVNSVVDQMTVKNAA